MKELVKSKKFLMSLAGIIAVVLGHFTGIMEDKIQEILAVIIAYVLGQGVSDFGKSAALINKKE